MAVIELVGSLSDRFELGSLYGESVPMRAAFSLIEKAAASDATVLLATRFATARGHALHALFLLQAARLAARVDAAGNIEAAQLRIVDVIDTEAVAGDCN